jgi:hypothetical protein
MNPLFRVLRLVIVTLFAVVATACGGSGPRFIEPDITFSVNIIAVPADWPIEDEDWPEDIDMALRQQRAYEKYGKPEFFRVRWNREGRVISRTELQQRMNAQKERKVDRFLKALDAEREWLYRERNLLLRFHKDRVEERPLPDTLRILCDFGDPHEVTQTADALGPLVVYRYFDRGKVFYFRNEKLFKEDTVPAMPGWGERF